MGKLVWSTNITTEQVRGTWKHSSGSPWLWGNQALAKECYYVGWGIHTSECAPKSPLFFVPRPYIRRTAVTRGSWWICSANPCDGLRRLDDSHWESPAPFSLPRVHPPRVLTSINHRPCITSYRFICWHRVISSVFVNRNGETLLTEKQHSRRAR